MSAPKSSAVRGYRNKLTEYGDPGFSAFLRRSFLSSAGFDEMDLDRPIVGIANIASEYATCHREMPNIIDAVRRGILEAGGIPFEFTAMAIGEITTNPTSMLYRNLMAMELEEQMTMQPMDAVVLVGGCDKTVPAEVMAAVSAEIPTIMTVVGPMFPGSWKGTRLGACTDCRRTWAEFRAGTIDEGELNDIQGELCPTSGTCMVMGTASTMACLLEALGLALPYNGTAPSASSERLRLAVATGRRAVELVGSSVRPKAFLSRKSLENAMIVLAAIGGSTNAVVHLTAMARRAGITLTPRDFDEASRRSPVLVDCKPVGRNYLPDFHRAGGMPALLNELRPLLHLDTPTIDGNTLGERLDGYSGPGEWQQVILSRENPVRESELFVSLYGSLAPNGALLKAAAASEKFQQHTGPAVCFDSQKDLEERIDDPALELTEDHVIIVRNIGPVASGMPEAGSAPIPKYLAQRGVRDMLRISDGRMSGTSYGAVVLHVAPESAVGGPLSRVQDGDPIRIDIPQRTLDVLVDSEVFEAREPVALSVLEHSRGYKRLFVETVEQADRGADFNFL